MPRGASNVDSDVVARGFRGIRWALAARIFAEVDHPVAGRLAYTGLPVLTTTGERPEALPAPCLGQHTDEILHELGLGDPQPVSAAIGKGRGDLLDRIVALLPAAPEQAAEDLIEVAVVGRPNVG